MIYLDNAATTKPDSECLKSAEKYLISEFYNPSALYKGGYGLQREIVQSRNNILSLIADRENFDLIFTSCGSEADNQAIFCGGRRGNIVTTAGEHSAVYSAVNELKQRGMEVRFAKIGVDGSVDTEDLLRLIDERTSLVSVIHVNNETGAINDIVKIAKLVKAKNRYCLFHSDGVQAFGKIAFKLSKEIDLYSVSAHKIGGIKGVGALIKRKGLILKPYIYGGGQENGLRSGTENVFGIKNFEYAALKKFKKIKENYSKAHSLKRLIIDNLDRSHFKIISGEFSSPYILSISAEGLRGETLLHEADDTGLIIGTGSACSSNEKKRFSRTIIACGLGEKIADGVVTLSFSSENSEDEALKAVKILNEITKNRKAVMSL